MDDNPNAARKANAARNPNAARKEWLGLIAKSPAPRVHALMTELGIAPEIDVLRAPEIGGVMVRGRAGANGAPFNMGEMTVTRASVKLGRDVTGHGYVQGRDKDHALRCAVIDALMQTDEAPVIEQTLLSPLRREAADRRRARAAKAAATKVDFFTMVRGEDQ